MEVVKDCWGGFSKNVIINIVQIGGNNTKKNEPLNEDGVMM